MRIVSLVPAATEICFAIDLGGDVVGVSPDCDYPPMARDLPKVSRTLLNAEGKGSAETSRMIAGQLASGDPLYEVDEDALRAAAPEVILTQGLCEVCAPMVDDVRAVAGRMAKKPKILALDPHLLRDVLADIERIGKTCNASVPAARLVEDLRDRIGQVAYLASHTRERPRILSLEWLDPMFLAGHWVPEMVDLAGGQDVLAKPAEKSRRVDPKEIAMAPPEVAVLMPCGFGLERTAKEAPVLTKQAWWRDLPAARRGRVWIADGSSYFNRPGPRLVTGLEILAHIVHPETFPRVPSPKDARPWTG